MGTHLSWGCRHRLSKIVTIDYVKQHGLTIKSGQEQLATIQVAGAIAEVCQKGPPSMSVDDGAGAAVEVIEKRYASGG